MNPIRLAGLALLVVGAACSDAVGPGRVASDLDAARLRWRAQNLHTYAFTLTRDCECLYPGPLYVAVFADTVAAVLDLTSGEAVVPSAGMTVDGLFDFIQSAIDHSANKIQVKFDGAKGFPAEIDYDGAAGYVDDEISYRASDVHPIPPRS